MRLKRFSQIDITEEERLYALNLTRRVKVAIGRTRNNIANELEKSAKTDREIVSKLDDAYMNYNMPDNVSLTNNKSVSKGLIKETRKRGGRVIKLPNSGGVFTNKESLKPIIDSNYDLGEIFGDKKRIRLANKLNNIVKNPKKKSVIVIDGADNTSIGTLAHEIGHQARSTSKNPITRFLHKEAERTSESFSRNAEKNMESNPIKTAYENFVRLSEEKGATKHGISTLKKLGVDDKVLEHEAKDLQEALTTYQLRSRASMKESLSNTIRRKKKRGNNSSH